MAKGHLHILNNTDEIQKYLTDKVLEIADKAVQDHGFFSIGISGGSVAKILCRGLVESIVDWTKWRVFFCDERHVPLDIAESTYNLYNTEWFKKIDFPDEHVFKINPDVNVDDAAEDYIAKIRTVFPGDAIPSLDFVLLGMGPDGHTCSLFPGHPGLEETSKLVIPIPDSPKPPPRRITLTFPVLNAAKHVYFIVTGRSKVDTIKEILETDSPLPAAQVHPVSGELHWLLDTEAADKVTNK